MKVQELRNALASKGLDTFGLKASLLERLEKSLKTSSEVPPTETPGQEGASLEEKLKQPSSQNPSAEAPVKVDKLFESLEKEGTSTQRQGTSFHLAPLKDFIPSAPAFNKQLNRAGPLADYEKKRRRAERFGTELQVSEAEKRRMRAARFGSGTTANHKEKKSEAEKMRARAVRFGIVNEETKKAAHAARFGKHLQQENLPESEKRKARAARFSAVSGKNNLKTKGLANTFVSDISIS